jgi:putative holliday junction resolvase
MEARFVALDIGESRIGVAVSAIGAMAVPVETVDARDRGRAARRIVELLREYEASDLVVGWPLEMSGREGQATERVERFLVVLRRELKQAKVEVQEHRWDERLSSTSADRVLDEHQVSWKKRRERIDQIAACHILQGFLDQVAHHGGK